MKISIITATLNSEETIADCIKSVQQQTYRNWEQIIVDGGSTDSTLQKIQILADERTKIVTQKGKPGIYAAFNTGIQCSSGNVLGFLNSDDYYASSVVLELVSKAISEKEMCGVFGNIEYITKRGGRVRRSWKSESLGKNRPGRWWMPPHPTLYLKKEWFEKVGGFNENYKISGDYDLILRLFQREDFSAQHIPDVLVKMRTGGISNGTVSAILRKTKEDWSALKRNNSSNTRAVTDLIRKNLSKLFQIRIS